MTELHTGPVLAYTRLSPGERVSARGKGNREAYGADAQRTDILRWAKAYGAEVSSWFEDIDISGGAELEHRPGLRAALAAVTKGSVLIVAKRDRLARDVFVDAMVTRLVERAGGSIVSADGNGNGHDAAATAFRQMLSVFAEFERAIIAGRIRAALAVKRARGEHMGPVPIGYRLGKDRRLVEDAGGQAKLALIAQLYGAGTSINGIARELNQRGIPSPKGRTWHASEVHRIVRRRHN